MSQKLQKNKVARQRVELRTAWMPAKQKCMGYQLSYCSIMRYREHTFLKGFLILLEPKNFVPDMTPDPEDVKEYHTINDWRFYIFFKPFDISICSTNSHILLPGELCSVFIRNGWIASIAIFCLIGPCWPPPILLDGLCSGGLKQSVI